PPQSLLYYSPHPATTTSLHPLSLHDALPILHQQPLRPTNGRPRPHEHQSLPPLLQTTHRTNVYRIRTPTPYRQSLFITPDNRPPDFNSEIGRASCRERV